MNFSVALKLMESPHPTRLSRTNWQRKNTYVVREGKTLVRFFDLPESSYKLKYFPTHEDLFESDWEIVR